MGAPATPRPRLRASKSIRASAIARWRALLLACLIAGATSTVAGAHGFGQRYELPLPLGLYLFGAAAVVALSFVVFGLFVRGAPHRASQLELLTWPLGRTIGRPVLLLTLQLIVLLLFIVAILAGLFGNQNPYRNITPTLVWIIWWVGFALVAAFVADFWSAANPWRTLFNAAHWLWLRSGRTRAFGLGLPYPQWLGVWPACLLLLIFCWVELVYPHSASPAHIASMILAYSGLTLTGMFVFGRDSWLRHGEVFSLVFGTLGLFAPIASNDRHLVLRPVGAGLIASPPVSTSMVAFVLLLLATVLYDGLIGTGEWALLESAVRIWLPQADSLAVRTAGLVAFWLVFLATYFATCMLMSAVASGRFSASEVARGFVLTLVPIAIGYHVAHYLVFLLIQGQYIIPLLSDPFGRGWNILGTAGYRVDIGLAGARFAWYAAPLPCSGRPASRWRRRSR